MQWLEAVPDKGKTCGTCTLCCKLFDVDWLEKPKLPGKWCHHCQPGKGCAIWQNLPQKCADYFCVWRIDPVLSPEWRPDQARFILTHAHQEAPLTVVVDPSFPDAYRREPYRSVLAKTARQHLEARGTTLLVSIGNSRLLLFPDAEIPIPDGVELHKIIIEQRGHGSAVNWRPVFPV